MYKGLFWQKEKRKKNHLNKIENNGDDKAGYILLSVTMYIIQFHYVKNVGHLKLGRRPG